MAILMSCYALPERKMEIISQNPSRLPGVAEQAEQGGDGYGVDTVESTVNSSNFWEEIQHQRPGN